MLRYLISSLLGLAAIPVGFCGFEALIRLFKLNISPNSIIADLLRVLPLLAIVGWISGRYIFKVKVRDFYDAFLRLLSPGLFASILILLFAISSVPFNFCFVVMYLLVPMPFVLLGEYLRSRKSGSDLSVKALGSGFRKELKEHPRRIAALGAGLALLFLLLGVVWMINYPVKGRTETVYETYFRGRKLNGWDALRLEWRICLHPNDPKARTLLMGFYDHQHLGNGISQQSLNRQYTWFVRNHPDSEVLRDVASAHTEGFYSIARSEWRKQEKRIWGCAKCLLNAGSQTWLRDPATAVRFLNRAETLDPKDARIPLSLGHAYEMGEKGLGLKKEEAQRLALEAYERSIAKSEEAHLKYPLISSMQVAMSLGEAEKARNYALQLLKWAEGSRSMKDGTPIFEGHIVLGELALKDNDLETAKRELLLAADSSGGPGLDTFGPNMRLAKGLLERGETDTVLQYLHKVSRFWKDDEAGKLLKTWEQDIRKGKIPNFGANLNY